MDSYGKLPQIPEGETTVAQTDRSLFETRSGHMPGVTPAPVRAFPVVTCSRTNTPELSSQKCSFSITYGRATQGLSFEEGLRLKDRREFAELMERIHLSIL